MITVIYMIILSFRYCAAIVIVYVVAFFVQYTYSSL